MWKRLQAEFELVDGDMKTINKLRQYDLRNVEVNDNITKFSVGLLHKKTVKRLLGKRNYVVKEPNNIFTFFDFFYKRIVLIVTIILCIVTFAILDQFIFRIKLVGLSGEEYTQVYNYLCEHGVKRLTLKKRARDSNLAYDITETFPFIASASIYIQGSSIKVVVARADNILPQIPISDIISDFDGVIGDIVVFSGNALVTVGDVVRKNDILVTGIRPTAIITIMNGKEVICVINNTVI